ncbi:MAG: right-handed parallel beta-helix repeat-containing protein [Pirellulales bacterium]
MLAIVLGLTGTASAQLGGIGGVVGGATNAVGGAVGGATNTVGSAAGAVRAAPNAVAPAVRAVPNTVAPAVRAVPNAVGPAVCATQGTVNRAVPAAANTVNSTVNNAVPAAAATVNSAANVNANVNANINANVAGNNQWRYKYHNNHWWYYQPDNNWVIYHNNGWVPYSAATYSSYYPQAGYGYGGGPQAYGTFYRGPSNGGAYYGNGYNNGYYGNGYNNGYYGGGYGSPSVRAGVNTGAAIGGAIGGGQVRQRWGSYRRCDRGGKSGSITPSRIRDKFKAVRVRAIGFFRIIAKPITTRFREKPRLNSIRSLNSISYGVTAMFDFRLLMAFLMCGASQLQAAEYFVSPSGDDAAAGTLERPFATLMRAQDAAEPGDVVQIRGGTYAIKETQIAKTYRIWAYVHDMRKSGAKDRPITYRAYQDERPIFDFSAVKPARRITAFHTTGSWIRYVGIEVVGVQVTMTEHSQSICFDNEGSHNVFERLSLHDGQAIGVYLTRGSHNLFLNCDAFNNYDYTSEMGKGGNVDGFGSHPATGSVGNVFRGCRAWFNSDDGYDCINAHEATTFENCWAFYNGYSPKFEKRADGNGFKIGGYGSTPADRLPRTIPRNVVVGCLAVRNKANGFYANHHPGGNDWTGNSAYRNGANFNMQGRLKDNTTEIPGVGHVLLNNLALRGKSLTNCDREKCELRGNSFDVELLSEQFESVDEAALTAPRDRAGNLPRTPFLRPAKNFPGIDKGVDVGRPFQGERPDWGAFEFEPAK